jgi:cysteine-rich repeat protein
LPRITLPIALALALPACGARTDLALDEIEESPRARCGDGRVDPGESCDDGGRRDGGCTEDCRLDSCGNGELDPGEACDRGDENEDRPALAVVQGALSHALVPKAIGTSPTLFYSYSSKSAHTGLEIVRHSRLFFTLGPGGLALFTVHGIDDSSGVVQPKSVVEQLFSGLPLGAGVVFADDGAQELELRGDFTARGMWSFGANTDGGVLGPLPFPGSWSIAVDTQLDRGIDTWQILGDTWDYEASPIELDVSETAYLVARDTPGLCRADCSVPRCGDGRLDGGEICDDGNTAAGDGCRGDCAALD